MEYNYISFSKDKSAVIPAIQRDYVQGSAKNREKRNQFLEAIFKTLLSENKQLNLDFIYGTGNGDEFLPVDGQQRLTTLYLLAWLLKQRSKQKDQILPRLGYRTRNSTRQFVEHLREYEFPENFDGERVISTHLLTKPIWFAEEWKVDPSIAAMLEMLDTMNEMLNRNPQAIDIMAERFFSEANPICFESVDMGRDYDLNEDMYIKMNARGKPLTDFENWKAEFGEFLKKHYKGVPYTCDLTVPEYFETAIEQNWCDLFWHHALQSWQNLSEKDRETNPYPRIDEFFMRFFEWLTEMLFYAQTDVEKEAKKLNIVNAQLFFGPNGEWKRENTFKVYKDKQNVLGLFHLLDLFARIEQQPGGLHGFFASLFTPRLDPGNTDKVNIFCGHDNSINLFSEIITKGIQTPLNYRMLLFGLCKRIQVYGPSSTNEFTDFLRVFWGWLCGYKQRNAQEVNVTSNLRVEHIRLAANILKHLLADKDVFKTLQKNAADRQISTALKNEISKADLHKIGKYDVVKKLSNYPELHFDLQQLGQAIEHLTVQECCDRFDAFHNLPDDQKVVELCKHGFTGVQTWNMWCRYYGSGDLWNYIFTSQDTDFNTVFTAWMVNSRPEDLSKNEMAWYMIKYPQFRNSSPWHYFYVENDFTVWARPTCGRMRMGLRNFCPYSYTVVKMLDKAIATKLNAEAYSYHAEQGCIWLPDYGISMYCVKNGWKILHDKKIAKGISKYGFRFKIHENNVADTKGKYKFSEDVLLDLPKKDRVETALDFLKDFAMLL